MRKTQQGNQIRRKTAMSLHLEITTPHGGTEARRFWKSLNQVRLA